MGALSVDVIGGTSLVILVYMTLWFGISLPTRRSDIADIAWGLGFVVIALWLMLRGESPGSARQYLVAVLSATWGVRLAWHVARRNLRPGHGEDPRYAAWRRDWGRWFIPRSFAQVFLLQGFFMLLISAPILVSGTAEATAWTPFDALGAVIWIVGFIFEALGDAQLARFLAEPSNKGHVMDRGLWAWTRHPNYFGEVMMWWGLAVICLSVSGGWIALVGPLTITWLLLKVSGIPMLEAKRAGRPEWEAYKARTSAFIPLPPRRG